jgi:hypothetical protein
MILQKSSYFETQNVDPDWDDDSVDLEKIAQRRAFCFSIHEDPTGVEQISRQREINRALLTLRPREERVVRLRFGLGGLRGREFTLDEVAALYDVSRERVRQIEIKALRRLQHPSRSKRLQRCWWDMEWAPPIPEPPKKKLPAPIPPGRPRPKPAAFSPYDDGASLRAYQKMVNELNELWRGGGDRA